MVAIGSQILNLITVVWHRHRERFADITFADIIAVYIEKMRNCASHISSAMW